MGRVISSRNRTFCPLLLGLLALALTGCGGSSGSDGANGSPGAVTSGTATSLNVTVSSVTINSPPVVEFSITDQDGLAFAGLSADDLRFTIAQLQPGTNGDASAWQNYINVLKQPVSGVLPAADTGTEDKVQATYEKATEGTLVNHGDGTYTYTFAHDITNITSPVAVTYDPTLTHRLAMQIENDMPVTNVIYTWQPSTGATSGILTRDIVTVDSCNECHNKLAMHGGGRIDTRYCVTCHNPGTADPTSGNTVDFKVLIHKIHRGATLPTEGVTIVGYHNSVNDFSDVVFPQDTRNCTKCHDGSDAATPDANNWQYRPTKEACGSCHDDVNFDTGANHPGGIQTNAACANCHASGGAAGAVAAKHEIVLDDEADKYQFNVVSVTNTAPGQFPQVTFSVTDPTNGDTPYDITTDTGLSNGSLNVDLGWSTSNTAGMDYDNEGTTGGPSQAVRVSGAGAADNGDGTYTVTSATAVPADATGSGAAALEGYPVYDLNGDGSYGHDERLAVKTAVAYFPITDSTADARREVVNVGTRCDNCHEKLEMHGGNRNDNAEACVICHNPNDTDVSQRPSDGSPGDDGLQERSIDFKRLIHGIHASSEAAGGFRETGYFVYGYRGSKHDFGEVRFPGILSDCNTCHVDDSYQVPLSSDVSPSVVDSGSTIDGSGTLVVDLDPSNDLVITPTAAVCSACHDKAIAQAHMEQNGAQFGVSRAAAAAGTETCEVCHSSGTTADVAVVHNVSD
jgi:OmcA/MtrC family decaheme c-type cytochrome